MECNKDEALRARNIAEQMMQSKNFTGAKKVVLRAQQLFPGLDSISQMLTVCEVHCSASIKVNGETDWYRILQLESTADESYIKKQYRKLALLLHPDKNKFAGAEAAFKLICEANVTLSDPVKRSVYDNKIKSLIKGQPSQQSNKTSVFRNQTWTTATSYANNINQQQQFGFSCPANTFWTTCPFCSMRSQYAIHILGRHIRCLGCLQAFVAYDMNVQSAPPNANSNYSSSQPGAPQQRFSGQYAHNANQQSHRSTAFSGTSFQENVDGRFAQAQPSSASGTYTKYGGETKKQKQSKAAKQGRVHNEVKSEEPKLEGANEAEKGKPSAGSISQKRARKIVDSTDSDTDTDSNRTDNEDVVVEDGILDDKNAGFFGSTNTRRSTRQKKHVTYNENGNEDEDDDFVMTSSKRLRKVGSTVGSDGKKFSEGDARNVKVKSSRTSDSGSIDKQKGKQPQEVNLQNESKPVNKSKLHNSGKGVGKEVKSKGAAFSTAGSGSNSMSKASPDLGSFSYPDPEFHDFDKDRDIDKFAADQIWAVYDDLDGMPRYYARIKAVYSTGFKVRYTWLEHNSGGESDSAWVEEELPVACGNYTLGKTETTQNQLMFSHLMPWGEGSRKNSYDIYPRKGEVWALFKGWDMSWISDADSHRVHEYEVVEVLSDFAEGHDITVICLVRVKGFVCLFMRENDKAMATLTIPPGDVLRFSHKVPSYRLTRDKREGIPEGSFELDPASLPADFEKAFTCVSLDESCSGDKTAQSINKQAQEGESGSVPSSKGIKGHCKDGHGQAIRGQNIPANGHMRAESVVVELDDHVDERVSKEPHNPHVNDAGQQYSPSSLASPSPMSYEYPHSEFYDFMEERSIEKFHSGQIWGIYSDINQYPSYYGLIKKIELQDSKVHVKWLEALSVPKTAAQWLKHNLPVACGTFKITREMVVFDSTDAFSHLIQVKASKRKEQYEIIPSIGEVWAIYRKWSLGWTRSDLDECEYDIVEISEQASTGVGALLLTKVDGYKTVFMPELKAGHVVTMEIPMDEFLRFSHRIPAFRLTDEKGGKLQGCLELDPASVPTKFLF